MCNLDRLCVLNTGCSKWQTFIFKVLKTKSPVIITKGNIFLTSTLDLVLIHFMTLKMLLKFAKDSSTDREKNISEGDHLAFSGYDPAIVMTLLHHIDLGGGEGT